MAQTEQLLQGKIKGLSADRGFDSAANRRWLKEQKIWNGICPRSPRALRERLRGRRFGQRQRRRAQTEGRIGIVKNRFLGSPLRVKGFARRELAVTWGVLTHNLWVLARLGPVPAAATEERQAA